MYLVLADEEDRVGFCLSECKGKMVRSGVCVSGGEKVFKANLTNAIKSIVEKKLKASVA